jgi:hypothetical protein
MLSTAWEVAPFGTAGYRLDGHSLSLEKWLMTMKQPPVRLEAGPAAGCTKANGQSQGLPPACFVLVSYSSNPAGDTTALDQPKRVILGRSANRRGTPSKYRFEHDQM